MRIVTTRREKECVGDLSEITVAKGEEVERETVWERRESNIDDSTEKRTWQVHDVIELVGSR